MTSTSAGTPYPRLMARYPGCARRWPHPGECPGTAGEEEWNGDRELAEQVLDVQLGQQPGRRRAAVVRHADQRP